MFQRPSNGFRLRLIGFAGFDGAHATSAAGIEEKTFREHISDMAKKLRDIDAADRAVRLQAAAWSGAGGIMGGAAGGFAAFQSGAGGAVIVVATVGGAVAGTCAVYFGATRIAFAASNIVGNIYHPDGTSTPPVREYSRARALTKHGDYERAAAAWELNVAEYPDDTVPYMELGRLHRNQFNDYEQSVAWYRKAIVQSNISGGHLVLVTQEIVEIYRHKLNQPQKAIPYLADFVRKFPDDPHAEGAKKQLEELRAELLTDRER